MVRRRLRPRIRRIMVLLVILAVAAGAFGLTRLHPSSGDWVQDLMLGIVGPCQRGLQLTRARLGSLASHFVIHRRVEEENRLLRAHIRSLKRDLARLEELGAENRRFRRLLELRPATRRPSLMAEVVGRGDPSAWFSSVTIDRGRKDGIRAQLPVVTPEGVVGQVVHAAGSYSRVRLATDPSSGIGVMERESRTPGVLAGQGTGQALLLRYLDRNAEVDLGDAIVTSGLDGVFPKGIPVGIISRIRRDSHQIFQEILVRPAVPFGRLEEVQILLPPPSLPGVPVELAVDDPAG